MGKRKKSSRKPQGPKKREPLATAFPCLFCNHEKSVTVKMEKKAGTGELMCKVCGQQFQTGINYLSAAVDVYSDWIDACDAVAKEAVGEAVGEAGTGSHSYMDAYAGSSNRMDSTQMGRGSAAEVEDNLDNEGDYDEAL